MKYLITLLVIIINLTTFTLNGIEIQLTNIEREYLNQLGTIKMGVDPDWYPMEFVDNNGNYSGIIPEILLLLETRLNIKFERIPTKNWAETIKRSRDSEFPVIPALNKTEYRDSWLFFTDPIMVEPNVAVTHKDFPQITDIKKLEGATLATIHDNMVDEWARKDFPNLNIIYKDNELECLRAVAKGEADLAIRSQLMSAYFIRKEGFIDLKINNQIPGYANHIRMGVVKSEPLLVDILNKGLRSITYHEKESIINKFVYINTENPPNYSLIFTLFSLGALLTIILIYWNRKLKKLNKRIKAGEEKQRAILNAIPDGLSIADLNGVITYVSKESVKMWGYSQKSEILGKNILGFIHPAYHEKALTEIRLMLEGTYTGIGEYKMIKKNGKVFYTEANAELIKDSDGKPYALLFVSRDITEKMKTELKLKDAVKRYESIMSQSKTYNWEIDAKGLYTYISSNVKDILGYDKSEIIGKKYFYDLFPEDIKDEFKKEGFRIIKNKETISNFENPIVSKAGKKMWFLSSGLPKENEVGEVIGYQGSDTDITLRKNAEMRLEFKNKYQRMVAVISAQFIDVNLSNYQDKFRMMLKELGTLIRSSHTYILEFSNDKKYFEYTYEWCNNNEESAKKLIKHIDINSIPMITKIVNEKKMLFINDFDHLIVNSPEKTFFDRLKLKSVLWIPIIRSNIFFGYFGFDSTSQTLYLSEEDIELLNIISNIIGDVYIRNNIESEKNMVQESLREATIQAQQANKAKSEFLANMSHEIRTPLNGVIGFTELLMNTDLDPVQEQYAYHTNVSGQALLGIINDILDFSKIEAGKLELDIVETDILELIVHTADILKYHAEKKNIEFLLDIDPNLPSIILADPVRLKQVLINLINNAIKFTQKGEVELNVEFSAIDKKKGKFTFSVKDTGIGISLTQKEKLFSAFSQADSSITRRYGGTGLGLTISNLLVEKMGSKIEVESREGVGSNFYFTIITEYKVEAVSLNFEEKLSKRVLLVDDNENNRQIMERNLSHWKIDFTSVDSGRKAIDVLKNDENIDLAIFDYSMPGMDGIEAITEIRANLRNYAQMPIILLLNSSSEDDEIRRQIHELNIKHTLTKPIQANELREYINGIFSTKVPKNRKNSKSTKISKLDNKGIQRVLIAEDVSINLVLIKTMITQIIPECQVTSVVNGKEAVEKCSTETFDMILMDVQMPIMDGLQATKLIREFEKNINRKTPIIALTAGATKEETIRCLEAGMNDFITKPIDQDRLISILDQYLEDNLD